MAGILHLSVINNQYEDTVIHMVGEGYEDDITLDNIHGLVATSSPESSDVSEVIEESTMEDFVSGERSSNEVLTTVGPRVIVIILFFKIFFWCGLFLKSILNFLQHCLCFIFWPWGVWDLSSLTRHWTLNPYIERWSLNHWTTKEVPLGSF